MQSSFATEKFTYLRSTLHTHTIYLQNNTTFTFEVYFLDLFPNKDKTNVTQPSQKIPDNFLFSILHRQKLIYPSLDFNPKKNKNQMQNKFKVQLPTEHMKTDQLAIKENFFF